MKKLLLLVFTLILALPTYAAEKLPPRHEVLQTLIKVNDYYLTNHPDPLKSIPYYSRKRVYEATI